MTLNLEGLEDDHKEIILKTYEFAKAAHQSVGQLRKYTKEPYINHPIAVYNLLRGHRVEVIEMLQAALLHDTVEDTPITIQNVRESFGDIVARLVWELTDKSRPEDGNRQVRKGIDRDNLANASAAAHTIKYADLIDKNGRSYGHSISINSDVFFTPEEAVWYYLRNKG